MLLPGAALASAGPQLPLGPSMQGGIAAGAPPTNEAKPTEILDAMLQLATLYRAVEPDQQDKLAMERVSTLVQQLLAKDQADTRPGTPPATFPGQ